MFVAFSDGLLFESDLGFIVRRRRRQEFVGLNLEEFHIPPLILNSFDSRLRQDTSPSASDKQADQSHQESNSTQHSTGNADNIVSELVIVAILLRGGRA